MPRGADVTVPVPVPSLETLRVKSPGEGGGETFTATLSEASPPGPVQESEYVFEEVRFPDGEEPEVPVQPSGETKHELALVEDQEMVASVLYGIMIGPSDPLAFISAVGSGGGAQFGVVNVPEEKGALWPLGAATSQA